MDPVAGSTASTDQVAAIRGSDDVRAVIAALERCAADTSAAGLDGLLEGLTSRGLVARQGAFTLLMSRLQVADELLDAPHSPLRTLELAIVQPLSTVYEPAAERLRELVRAGGVSGVAEAIPPAAAEDPDGLLERFSRSAADRSVPFDVAAVRGLSGSRRTWAETYLLARVGFGEARAAEACAALPLFASIPALYEAMALHAADPDVQAAMAAAFADLGGTAIADAGGLGDGPAGS